MASFELGLLHRRAGRSYTRRSEALLAARGSRHESRERAAWRKVSETCDSGNVHMACCAVVCGKEKEQAVRHGASRKAPPPRAAGESSARQKAPRCAAGGRNTAGGADVRKGTHG